MSKSIIAATIIMALSLGIQASMSTTTFQEPIGLEEKETALLEAYEDYNEELLKLAKQGRTSGVDTDLLEVMSSIPESSIENIRNRTIQEIEEELRTIDMIQLLLLQLIKVAGSRAMLEETEFLENYNNLLVQLLEKPSRELLEAKRNAL